MLTGVCRPPDALETLIARARRCSSGPLPGCARRRFPPISQAMAQLEEVVEAALKVNLHGRDYTTIFRLDTWQNGQLLPTREQIQSKQAIA